MYFTKLKKISAKLCKISSSYHYLMEKITLLLLLGGIPITYAIYLTVKNYLFSILNLYNIIFFFFIVKSLEEVKKEIQKIFYKELEVSVFVRRPDANRSYFHYLLLMKRLSSGVRKFCPNSKFPDISSAGLTRFDCIFFVKSTKVSICFGTITRFNW